MTSNEPTRYHFTDFMHQIQGWYGTSEDELYDFIDDSNTNTSERTWEEWLKDFRNWQDR